MAVERTNSYLQDARGVLADYKKLTERAMAQASEEDLAAVLDGEMNSIAILVKHLAGNMRSRFTHFLTTDGEKPDRNRNSEFFEPPPTREALLAVWEQGWSYVFQALDSLSETDLTRTVVIRGEEHSVMQAINRQMAHYIYHCGQIVMLAKHFASDHWQVLMGARPKSSQSHPPQP